MDHQSLPETACSHPSSPGSGTASDGTEGSAGANRIGTELGGITLTRPDEVDRTWGYDRSVDERDYARAYAALLDVIRPLEHCSGFCYTQFADTYQEANGLLYADRAPRFPIEVIAGATRGERP